MWAQSTDPITRTGIYQRDTDIFASNSTPSQRSPNALDATIDMFTSYHTVTNQPTSPPTLLFPRLHFHRTPFPQVRQGQYIYRPFFPFFIPTHVSRLPRWFFFAFFPLVHHLPHLISRTFQQINRPYHNSQGKY